MTDPIDVEVREALYDFHRYLLDQIPPLTASEAVETLMQQPPELVVRQIHAWAVEQSRVQSAAMSDFLFHALKKIHLCGALKVLDAGAVDEFLAKVIPHALQACPVPERDTLLTHLAAMRTSQTITSAPVQILKSEGTAAAAREKSEGGSADTLVARSARRLSLVIDRLTRLIPGGGGSTTEGTPKPIAEAPAAQLVTMAAKSARSHEELQNYIESLRPYTGETQPENLFRMLGRSVPGWEIVSTPEASMKPAASLEAMHRIMTLTDNPNESNRRFRDLLTSAVEQFNGGSLGAAVSILDLAESIVPEKKLDPSSVEKMREDASHALDQEQLRKNAENKAKHALLRKLLTFFPEYRKERLLQDLRGEARRERRRSLLGLLEAYGAEGRDAALAELELELNRPQSEADTYYLRNLIYLLHRIQREPSHPIEKELELLTRATARGQNIYVIKEAVIPIGQAKSEAAVKLLTMRLAETEAMLVRSDTSLYPMDEMQKLVDRIVAALGRIGTPAALLTIARHGMKPNPLLGDTRSRLTVLSQHDLSFDEQTVMILVKAIRDDLPTKLLGRVLPQRQVPPVKLIEALSSTRSEVVESLFAEVAERYPDHEVGRAANLALANLNATPASQTDAAATLTGDLQFFGLPSLLQSLRENQATGIVTLSSRQAGQTAGKILVVKGQFVDAQSGHLRGVDAMYQLLERPVVGTFVFVPQAPEKVSSRNPHIDVMPLLFEGMRRYDELKQAIALAPDDLIVKPTGTKPTPESDENDPAIVREVWVKATSGVPVAEWESAIATDAYRIRRLVAHWIEEGALQPA